MTGFMAESSVKNCVGGDFDNLEIFDRPSSIIRLASISQNCWFASVKVNKSDVHMLVDTGSDVTLLSAEVFKRMNMSNSLLKNVSTRLTTADGDPLEVMGMTSIPLVLGGQSFDHPVVVAGIGDLSGILGIDFMSKNKVSFDTAEGVLRSPRFEVALNHQASHTVCARVHLTETIHIPANSEIFVEGEVRGHFSGEQNGCLEPLTEFKGGNDLLMPKSLVQMTKSKVMFSILNPTQDSRILKKNLQVASVQPVDKVVNYSTDQGIKQIPFLKGNSLPDHLKPLIENCSEKLGDSEINSLASVINEYTDIFVGPDGKLGHTDLVQHEINVGDARPIKLPLRRLPITQRAVAEKEIDKMLQQGIIEPSNSSWGANIVLVSKSDGTTRFCVDYRKLNGVTKKDAFPLPRIDESLEALSGAKFFCTADMASSFHQVSVREEDREKTAFVTHKGLFHFKHMPFGLVNSPKTFERLIELVMKGLQWEKCLVYLDDVIVFGKTFTETLNNLTLVFDRFRKAKLKLKPKKCAFFRDEIKYLGHIVSEHGVQCDPAKISAIKNWPKPTNVSDIKSFLGIASYYRNFILNFSNIAFPLTQLTRKNQKFQWSESCEKAFSKLRDALISAPILSYPTPDGPYILDTDASLYGIGAVLSQVQNGEERVIAYGSKTLSRSQIKYCTTYRELLAVVTFVKQFKYYLFGRNFLLRTDHASLVWLKNFKEPEGMVARWISLLDTYDMTIQHRKGSAHGNADSMSRIPRRRCNRENCPDCKNNLPCHVMAVNRTENITYVQDENQEISDSNWLSQWSSTEISRLQRNDSSIGTIMRFLESSREKPKVDTADQVLYALLRQWDSLIIQNGLLCRKFYEPDGSVTYQLVAPKEIRKEIMLQLHNNRTACHLGREKTLHKVRSRFYWPFMTSDVSRWCQTCPTCAKGKPGPGLGRYPMQHCNVTHPLECIAIDIMGPLPITDDGNEYIMVVGDYFSKWKEAYALKNHTAQTVADKLTTEFICRFGAPTRIHTDQGREFESELFSEICKLLGIHKSRTTPYRPQSDGMVERYNRTAQSMLAMLVNENRSDWDDHLPFIMMAYRASVHESTKCTPNLLLLGREIRLPIDVIAGPPPENEYECPIKYVEWVKEAMQNSFEFAYENLETSFRRQKRFYDVKLKPRSFEKDQLVWYWYPPKAKLKLGLGWTGPFKVLRKISDVTYQIESCQNKKMKIIHVDHLKGVEGDGIDNQLAGVDFSLKNLFESGSSESVDTETEGTEIETDPVQPETTQNSPKYSSRGRLLRPACPFSP